MLSLQILKIEGNRLKNGERTNERKKEKKTIKIEKIQVLWKQKKIGNRIKLKGQDEEKKNDRLFPEYDYWSQILIMR